jgi:hypothetical protein
VQEAVAEHLQYYEGLNKIELAHHSWLIVLIEAAWYCESRHVSYIRYLDLKRRSDDALNTITNGERSEFGGGSFASILSSDRCKKFLCVDKVGEKETRISPDIPLIQAEIKARKIENLDNHRGRFDYLYPGETANKHRKISESVKISDDVKVSVSKAH